MASWHRLAGTLAFVGAVLSATVVVRGWLALRDLLNPPQLAAQDLAFQLSVIALPLVGAFLVGVRRTAAGAVLLATLGALELPGLWAGLAELARDGVGSSWTTPALEIATATVLVAAGVVAWAGRSGRVRTVRSRVQPVLWLAGVAVATRSVFPTISHEIPGFGGRTQPDWFEPVVTRVGPVEVVASVATVVLVGVVVAVASGWPRDVAAGAYMALALPVLLSGLATLSRALRDPETVPTVWAWVVPVGAGILVALATWWWNTHDAAEADGVTRSLPPTARS